MRDTERGGGGGDSGGGDSEGEQEGENVREGEFKENRKGGK